MTEKVCNVLAALAERVAPVTAGSCRACFYEEKEPAGVCCKEVRECEVDGFGIYCFMRFRFGKKMKLLFLTIRVGDNIRMSLYGTVHEEVRIFCV